MVIKMKYKKKITKIGSSEGIVIDKIIKNSLNLKKGDMVEFTIKKCDVMGRSLTKRTRYERKRLGR